MRNTGKPSEQTFEEQIAAGGGVVFRMRDAADLHGLNKKRVAAFGQPSDFIVVSPLGMFFAEVKSSNHKTSLSLDCLTRSQKAAAAKCAIANAGQHYRIYIHNMLTDQWYIMYAYEYVVLVRGGVKSVKWQDLKPLKNWLF